MKVKLFLLILVIIENPFFEFGLSDYFTQNIISVVVKPDGSFEKKIPVQNIQAAFFVFNDSLPFYCTVLDKDTLSIYWEKSKELTNEQKFALINQVYNRNVQAVFDSADFFSELRSL